MTTRDGGRNTGEKADGISQSNAPHNGKAEVNIKQSYGWMFDALRDKNLSIC